MWYAQYIGKPWKDVPDCVDNFNCGELVRHVFRTLFGIHTVPIMADANNYRSIVKAMVPKTYDLVPVVGRPPQEFDIAFFKQGVRENHVGVAAQTNCGLMVLHCTTERGVVLTPPFELIGFCCRELLWCQHISKPNQKDIVCP